MNLIVLPGDGIGPEITDATLLVLEHVTRALSLDLTWDVQEIGLASLRRVGTTLPPSVLDACRRADGVILGPVSTADYPARDTGGINVSAELRIQLDLFANVRPSRTREGLQHWGRTPMDLVIVRENTEGFYADRNMHSGSGELMPTPDLALSIRKISASASSRIARAAFELAATRRRHVTDISYDEQLVDSMAALLVRDAARFDVIVTTNMFGDILSDEASELSGSLGLAASINAGDRHCMAQAQHGSAPDIHGQNKANPTSLISPRPSWLGRRHTNDNYTAADASSRRRLTRCCRSPACARSTSAVRSARRRSRRSCVKKSTSMEFAEYRLHGGGRLTRTRCHVPSDQPRSTVPPRLSPPPLSASAW